VKQSDAPPAPETAAKPVERLAAARCKGSGVIRGISNCAQAGLISAAAMSDLDDRYALGVESLLLAASLLMDTAALVRRLVSAIEQIDG
jgi:tetrahydromethanopterin S-methyltransferase subunit D